jgi:hypothetical protein
MAQFTLHYKLYSTTGGSGKKYPLADIARKEPKDLPEGVDPGRKEDFINDDDFQSIQLYQSIAYII